MNRKPLPIGISDFKTIIEGGYAYADKTLLVQELLEKGNSRQWHERAFPEPPSFAFVSCLSSHCRRVELVDSYRRKGCRSSITAPPQRNSLSPTDCYYPHPEPKPQAPDVYKSSPVLQFGIVSPGIDPELKIPRPRNFPECKIPALTNKSLLSLSICSDKLRIE